MSASAILVEEPLGGVVGIFDVLHRQRFAGVADRELLTTGADRLAEFVEQDLEAREPLIEEVLRFQLEPTSVGLSGLDDLSSTGLGGPDDLGALDHPLGLARVRPRASRSPRGASC